MLPISTARQLEKSSHYLHVGEYVTIATIIFEIKNISSNIPADSDAFHKLILLANIARVIPDHLMSKDNLAI